MKDERLDRDDSDADLRALQTALTEFVSQLDIEAPRPDEPPPRAPVDTGRPLSAQPEPTKVFIPVTASATPGTHVVQAPGRSNGRRRSKSAGFRRRWSLWLPTSRLRTPLLAGVVAIAIAIAASVAAAIGWWPAVGRRAQVATARGPVVQTQSIQTQSITPPGQKPQHTPRSPVREAQPAGRVARPPVRETQLPGTVARPPARAPNNVGLPVRRAAAARPPLPAPVVDPPVPAVARATLSRPPVVPSISERVAPLPEPGAVIPPGTVYQELPRPLVIVDRAVSVLLVLIINEHGRVDRAFIGSMPVLPRYEQQLLEAAKIWRYTPAFQNGRAIPYRKTLRVTVPASSGFR
jgi:hypothetical protein